MPKMGGVNYCSIYRSINSFDVCFSKVGLAKRPYLTYSFALDESIIMSDLSLIREISLSLSKMEIFSPSFLTVIPCPRSAVF